MFPTHTYTKSSICLQGAIILVSYEKQHLITCPAFETCHKSSLTSPEYFQTR